MPVRLVPQLSVPLALAEQVLKRWQNCALVSTVQQVLSTLQVPPVVQHS